MENNKSRSEDVSEDTKQLLHKLDQREGEWYNNMFSTPPAYIGIAVALLLALILLSGCRSNEPVQEWVEAIPQQVMPLTTEDYFPLVDILDVNPVEQVMVRVINRYLEVEYIPLVFTEHGLLNGQHHVMVPLTEQMRNVFNMFGMTVAVDITGTDATLTRGRRQLTFSEGMLAMFIDREETVYLPDMPFKHRGTLYVPFEPILDVFGIGWEINNNILVIGG